MARERATGGRKEAAIEMREKEVKEEKDVKEDAASHISFSFIAIRRNVRIVLTGSVRINRRGERCTFSSRNQQAGRLLDRQLT